MILHNPGNESPITVLYAWVSEDEKGNQGIIAVNKFPLVFNTKEFIEKFRPVAEQVASMSGLKARILKFELVEE